MTTRRNLFFFKVIVFDDGADVPIELITTLVSNEQLRWSGGKSVQFICGAPTRDLGRFNGTLSFYISAGRTDRITRQRQCLRSSRRRRNRASWERFKTGICLLLALLPFWNDPHVC